MLFQKSVYLLSTRTLSVAPAAGSGFILNTFSTEDRASMISLTVPSQPENQRKVFFPELIMVFVKFIR